MIEFYLWSGHVGHRLEVGTSKRDYVLGDDEEMGQEETVVVRCLDCAKVVAEYGHDVAIRWNIEDVQSLAELTQGEAESVLEDLEGEHDANVGIKWDVIESAIRERFPKAIFRSAWDT